MKSVNKIRDEQVKRAVKVFFSYIFFICTKTHFYIDSGLIHIDKERPLLLHL